MITDRSGQATIMIVAVLFFVVMLLLLTLLGVPLQFSLAVLIGSLIFIISFVNTDMALIILIFSMLLSPEFAAGETSGRSIKIRADDIFIIIIFFGWVAKMAINKELGLLRSTRLNHPILIYIVICLISSFMRMIEGGVNIRSSIFYLLKYTEYFMLFFLVANNLKTVAQAKKYIFYLFLTCAVVCLYAMVGVSTGERVSAPFEVGGIGAEPNTLAGYLMFMMALMIGFVFNSRAGIKRAILIGLFSLAAVPFLYTLSRSGWASFFVVIAAFIIFNKKYRIALIAVLAVVIVVLPLVAPKAVHKRINETFTPFRTYNVMGAKIGIDESGVARIDSWKVGFRLWVKRPILGYGIPAGYVIDNQYTRVLTETGILGFAAFLAILITIFKAAHNVYKTMPEDDFAQAVSIGFLSGFMGILLFSTAAAAFIIIRIMEPFWFVVAIITVLPELEKDDAGAEVI